MPNANFCLKNVPTINVTPWILNFYLGINKIQVLIEETFYVQLLKFDTITTPSQNTSPIIVISDSEVKLYATVRTGTSLNEDWANFNGLKNSVGAIILIKTFTISIERIESHEPPILIINSYEILSGAYPHTEGKPEWIYENKSCSSKTLFFRRSNDAKNCIQNYNATFPDYLRLHETNEISQMSDEYSAFCLAFRDFRDFSLLFDRCILSNYLEKEISYSGPCEDLTASLVCPDIDKSNIPFLSCKSVKFNENVNPPSPKPLAESIKIKNNDEEISQSKKYFNLPSYVLDFMNKEKESVNDDSDIKSLDKNVICLIEKIDIETTIGEKVLKKLCNKIKEN